MNKLNMESKDIVSENIEKISQIFPNVIVESEKGKSIDFDLLKQELSKEIVEGNKEKYQLTWPGKKQAIITANRPTNKTLIPLKEKSVDFDNTQNIYIEGDNLEALKILQESYLNKIKCIYIDPPYNTGNDFIYNDKYVDDEESELKQSGQIDYYNNRLISNLESRGRFHSDWLSMMYSRLKLARNFLSEDGAIFISIDDNEVYNLKLLCDEIFGEKNFEADFHIKVRHEKRILREDIRYQLVMEHLLCYRKNTYNPTRISKEEKEKSEYIYNVKILNKPVEILHIGGYKVEKYSKNDYKVVENKDGLLKKYSIRGSLISQRGSASEFYELNLRKRKEIDGFGTLYKVIGMGMNGDGLGYRYIVQPDNENIKNGTYFQGKPLVEKENKGLPHPNYYDFVLESNNVGKEANIEYKNGKKPLGLINKIFDISGINNDKNAIVMDFFAGSSTTAHAVMQLNAEDNGNRKYIMVQLPDNIEKSVNFSSYNFPKIENYEYTICDIGQKRIKNAVEELKKKYPNSNFDKGFRVYKVDSSNMKDVYYKPSDLNQSQLNMFESNIKENRTPEDLLTQVILNLGLTLDLKIEEKKILNNNVYFVESNSLVACFDDRIDINIIDEICKCKPLKIVFKENSFKNDSEKINTYERIKKLSPETEVNIL